MKESHFWNFILTHLRQHNTVMLTAVVNHTKGSPGKQGFKMAVSSDGELAGSIGGGVMEYKLIKYCKDELKKKSIIKKIETLEHNKKPSARKSGLICSGSQTNFTTTLRKSDTKSVKEILNALQTNTPGKITYQNNKIFFRPLKGVSNDYNFEYKNEGEWLFEQAVALRNNVYVIGGGHVGLAVCKVLAILDFNITLYDNRKNLKMIKENKYADRILTGDYSNVGKFIEPDSYVVIVTTGFQTDKEALEQVLDKNAKYIGLMGSMSKIKKIFNEAVKDGVKKSELAKIHAPIGIDINSDTPEEIAVSIAAEIIKVKNNPD